MKSDLREGVLETSSQALSIVKEYFNGTRPGSSQVREAMRMIGYGIKVDHMNQLAVQNDRSTALRLIRFLPTEVDKAEYIRITNPQIAGLLKKPEKK